MKRGGKGDIFETYRPKGLARTSFKDNRYTLVHSPPTPRSSIPTTQKSTSQVINTKIKGNYSLDHTRSKKQEVLHLTREYIAALNLQDCLQEDMANAFDCLFPLFPRGSGMHETSQLAEIIVFHVLKTRNLFLDPVEFMNVSQKGNMPMSHRSWLLRYKQYLPANERKSSRISPNAFLNLLYGSPRISAIYRERCEKIKPIIFKLSGNTHPKIVAGMVCYMAFKTILQHEVSITKAMELMGIKHLGTIINAVKRTKARWQSVWALFFKEKAQACRDLEKDP